MLYMKEVRTVFKIKDETYAVDGSGQSTMSQILNQFPQEKIILLGFMIGGEFVPANLESSMYYS